MGRQGLDLINERDRTAGSGAGIVYDMQPSMKMTMKMAMPKGSEGRQRSVDIGGDLSFYRWHRSNTRSYRPLTFK